MPKIIYADKSFRPATMTTIYRANQIIAEYSAQGFSLTLRQLYYQMVARGIISNKVQEYKRLGSILSDARLAGLVDWLSIVDRTRALRGNQHWDSPASIMEAAVKGYKIDKWENQPHRVEVWIEKDALTGVISGICRELDIDYFSCRGYTSASEMWRAGIRLAGYIDGGQEPIILHFGDHDPSGMDMTRDISERLGMFAECYVNVNRVALNMDQIEEYDPPPNPAKLTDSRAKSYITMYGYDSWELDALEPTAIVELIENQVLTVRDVDLWNEMVEREEVERETLVAAKEQMDTIDPPARA